MWGRLWIVAFGAFAACYTPIVAPGTPCEPAAGCPYGLVCAVVDGAHVCVETAPPLDGATPPPDTTIAPSGWAIVQTHEAADTRMVTIEPTGAGHTIIVGIESGAGAFANDLKDDAGNTYDRINNARSRNLDRDFGLEIWHATPSRAGATRIEVNGGTIHAVVMWEVSGLAPAGVVDMAARIDNQLATTMPSGAAVTTSSPGELVIAITLVANSVTALATGSPFTIDHTTKGNGWAHLTATDAPAGTYQTQWIQSDLGAWCASSVAFRAAVDP